MAQSLVGHCRGQTKTREVESKAQIRNGERGSNPLKGILTIFEKIFLALVGSDHVNHPPLASKGVAGFQIIKQIELGTFRPTGRTQWWSHY